MRVEVKGDTLIAPPPWCALVHQLLEVTDLRDGSAFAVARIQWFSVLDTDPHQLSNQGGPRFLTLENIERFVLTEMIRQRVPIRPDPIGSSGLVPVCVVSNWELITSRQDIGDSDSDDASETVSVRTC